MGIPGSDRAVVLEALPSLLATVDLVLDALVGYRWQGVPCEPIASLIYAANRASVPRLALDLPSGLEGDSGRPSAVTIQADATWPTSLSRQQSTRRSEWSGGISLLKAPSCGFVQLHKDGTLNVFQQVCER